MQSATIHFDEDGLSVILICGGRVRGRMKSRAPESVKALISLGGRSLLECALLALAPERKGEGAARLPRVASAAVVGPPVVGEELARIESRLELGFAAVYVPERDALVENIIAGVEAVPGGGGVLVISPDLPFITHGALADFLRRVPDGSGLSMPFVTREDFLSEFPGAPNWFNRLSGEMVTLGSVLYFKREVLKKDTGLFRDAYRSRKNPGKLAGILGVGVFFKLIFGTLAISEIEERMSVLLDARVSAVMDASPFLAYDIDNETNLEYAEKYIASRI